MDAIKEFCEITKICTEDFFSTYLKAEEHKAIAVVRKLGSENEYFLNLDGWHTGASSREIEYKSIGTMRREKNRL